MTTNLNIFSCVLHISNYKKQFSTCCPYLTKTIISQCRTYNVPNLCIYLPIFSVFNTICYSFMVHSFHRAASILLPVLTIVTGILKMLSNIFNVPNLCIYLPNFSVFNTICYSFMVHSFHRAASILLPVLTIVTGILKMLSNIFYIT